MVEDFNPLAKRMIESANTKYVRIDETGTLTNDIRTTLTNLTYIKLCSPKMQITHYFQAPMVHLQKLTIHKDIKHVTNKPKGLKLDRPHSLTIEILR